MNPSDRDLLAQLLLRWEELYEHGQDTPAEELAKEHPHLIPELLRRIKALKTVSWIQKPLDDDPPDDGSSSLPPTPKTLLNRYRLDELIAEGGFARVYRAFDQELQRVVAVKLPKPERLHSTEAFLAEARRVARLKHDGIVAVYDCGIEKDSCFIVSEFMDGGSLADRIVAQTVSREEAVRWVTGVAEALDFAHRNGVIHRDLKPANILIDQHGRAKLADFGIAQSASKSGDFAPSLGTLRYMAPEALQGAAADHLADIFSLGVVLHEALTGRIPYAAKDTPALRREILAGKQSFSSEIGERLRAICHKALSHNPKERHHTAAQFAAELQSVGDHPTRLPLGALLVGCLGLAAILSIVGLRAPNLIPTNQPPSDSQPVVPAPPLAPRPLEVEGFGDLRTLDGTMPQSWKKPGVFAEITGAGVARYPRLPQTQFVVELDMEIRNTHAHMNIVSGEPGSNVDLVLGDIWEGDPKQDKVACRLFRAEPFGVRWIGETHLPPKTRMALKLVVNDDMKALIRDGLAVVGSSGDSSDLCLSFFSSENMDATIYSAKVRPLTQLDVSESRQVFFPHVLKCDVKTTESRLSSQIDKVWATTPSLGSPTVLEDLRLPLRWIEPDEFVMGTTLKHFTETGKGGERVKLNKGFWIGAYEVTQGQWDAVVGGNPSRITGSPHLPVNGISWSDACSFCEKLTSREKNTGHLPDGYEYRLPTEAEWESACRAGKEDEFSIPQADIPVRNDRFETIAEAGASPPNAWGLHEMLGNVPEWCLDRFVDYPERRETPTADRFHEGDPASAMFVVRGGSFWMYEAGPTCFSRTRRHDLPGGFRGFRVVLGPTIPLRHAGKATPLLGKDGDPKAE
jgi:formylglycine-generating enzyme required for sulfatase activity/tRNA A-37 threonylcarbamoyl transferase component Bud32